MFKLKLKMYRKLFVSAMTIFCVAVLSIFVLVSYYYIQTATEYEQTMNEKKMGQVLENIRYDVLATDNAIYSLYESPQLVTDLQYYLQFSPEQYYSYRLSQVTQQSTTQYQGHEAFIQNIFGRNQRIQGIGLYSYSQDMLTTFTPYGSVQITPNLLQKRQREEQIIALFKQRFQLEDGYALPLAYPVKRSQSSEVIGEIIIFQNLQFIDTILQRYEDHSSHVEVIVNDHVIYDSTGNNPYLSYRPVSLLRQKQGKSYEQVIREKTYTFHDRFYADNIFNYVGVGYFYACIGVVIIIIGGIYFIWRRMKQAEERLELVLAGIQAVESGNHDAEIRLPEQNEDELTLIAANLNLMNKELKHRIQEQYLTEINQQKAELAFLQSQINPHFLYNTLETIRMKAIVEGNREVGQLIYNLATLFRQVYQKARIITIQEELALIETYMELFLNRYPNQFTYTLICDESLYKIPIMKFILQPIIENYFIHGLDYTREDNHIRVELYMKNECVHIMIVDNGSGMDTTMLQELNMRMKSANVYEIETSIALVNIKKRLDLVYGDGYRFVFTANEPQGLCVCITLPKEIIEKEHDLCGN